MHLFDVLKRNYKQLIFIGIIIIILSSIGIIYFINYNNPPKSAKITYKSDLKGYSELRPKIDSLLENPNVPPVMVSRVSLKYKTLEDNEKSSKDKYDATLAINFYLNSLYSDTNNPIFRPISEDLGNFAKLNFPTLYEKKMFDTVCQDKSCAESPQPKEILKIIDDIKKSNLPDELKKTTAQDLLNPGFLPNNKRSGKVRVYFIILNTIKGFTTDYPSKEIQNIYNELDNYLEKYFSSEYEDVKIEYNKMLDQFIIKSQE